MKTTLKFNLSSQLKELSEAARKASDELKSSINKAIEMSADKMLDVAKANTPHIGDGKVRGKNMITNELYSSWRIIKTRKDGVITNISLANDKEYAKFIQYGHRISKHFVPWLYFDNGKLSRSLSHSGKIFGVVVGTKTKYVDGIDMIGPAIKAFNDTLKKEASDALNKINLDKK